MSKIIQSKVSKVITQKTLVYETDNHIFKVINAEIGEDGTISHIVNGTIEHKNGQHCGDFDISNGDKRSILLNINVDCKELLCDFVEFVNSIESKNIIDVDEFDYEKKSDE